LSLVFGGDRSGQTRRAWVLAGIGASISAVGYTLAGAGGLIVARGGRARGKLHLFYTPEQLQAGVDTHNDQLAEQLGYERGAQVRTATGFEWALVVTPSGPHMVGRF